MIFIKKNFNKIFILYYIKFFTVFVYIASLPRVGDIFVICSCILFLSPECIYLTSVEIKQLNCKNSSLPLVGGSSSDSIHFNSVSNVPPKYCSINDRGL